MGLLGNAVIDGQYHYLQAASEKHNSIFKKQDDIEPSDDEDLYYSNIVG